MFFNLETTFPKTGPGTSAFMTSRWLFLLLSIIARAKTNTPIPPIKWVKLRQKRREWVRTPTSSNIVAPVVVKPELTSKKASIVVQCAVKSGTMNTVYFAHKYGCKIYICRCMEDFPGNPAGSTACRRILWTGDRYKKRKSRKTL